MDNSTDLVVLAFVAAPASFITGFAAAAMSFTAWNFIVPLMFVAFKLPVFQALFMSIMLDVCNGITLTLIYGLNGKVDFRYGLSFGLYAATIGVVLALGLSNYIYDHQEKLSSAASFVPLLIGIQFLVRGFLALRDKRKKKKLKLEEAAAAVESKDPVEEPAVLGSGYVIINAKNSDETLAAVTINGEVDEEATVPRRKKQSPPEDTSETNEKAPLVPGVNSAYGATPEKVDEEDEYDDENVNQGNWRFWLYLFMERFAPDENILHRPLKYPGMRIAFSLIVFTILGGVAGMLYAGGGMFYANVIVNAWGANVRTAAGTGTFIMAMVMLTISFTFIGREDMDSINNLYHVLFSVPFGILGAIAGARLALRISDMVMYFVIVGVSFSLFIYIVVQNYIFSE